MKERLIINSKELELILKRLCRQLIENHNDFSDSVIIGLQPRGVFVAERLIKYLGEIPGLKNIQKGNLDITFFRDDFRRTEKLLVPNDTEINFLIEDKKVILVDDVLYTGRTTRAGLDALMAYGRPELVELLVLIDRRYSRHLPIQPDYVGKQVDTLETERVKVQWKENGKSDKVTLYTPGTNG